MLTAKASGMSPMRSRKAAPALGLPAFFGLALAAFLASFIAISAASPQRTIKGVETALKVLKTPRKDIPSSAPARDSFQSCHVFPNFVVVELDSGQIGADMITLRKRGPKDKKGQIKALCETHSVQGEIPLAAQEQYFFGAAGDFLFTRSADATGAEGGLWVYDSATGKTLHEASYHLKREFLVRLKNKTLSLEYFHRMKLNCSLAHASPKCWDETLKDNAVPSAAALKRADCASVFKGKEFRKYPKLLQKPDAVQVFAKIRIADVRNVKLQYLGGRALCNASP